MKKTLANRLITMLLTLALVITMLPGMATPAYAGGDPDPGAPEQTTEDPGDNEDGVDEEPVVETPEDPGTENPEGPGTTQPEEQPAPPDKNDSLAEGSEGDDPNPSLLTLESETPGLPDHLIINQAAGVGKNADGALSHSFVEIYNPTGETVELANVSLQYAENGAKWYVLKLAGSIPPKHSYLVRANGSTTSTAALYTIHYADQNWSRVISNDSFKFALVDGLDALTVKDPGEDQGVIDLLGAYNTSASVDYGEGGHPLRDISKQKSARRVAFQDTDDNTADFESLHYGQITPDRIKEVRPRSLRDGDWDENTDLELPIPPISGTIGFSAEAGLYDQAFMLSLNSSIPGAVIRYT
ncbi:MAG: lamin tail domain-containing protein, partial [Clostridiales bacterium]|nr:lamin tail domain-containing protein [Clostridiales bacterium]